MTSAIRLSAKPVLESLEKETLARVSQFSAKFGRKPKLSVIIVGEDPASQIYVRRKGEKAVALGMESETIALPPTSSPAEVKQVVDRLNADPRVDGILIQRPLPKSFVEEEIVYWVAPEKDVDAFHPENTGRMVLGLPAFAPCTPAGVMRILKHYGIDPRGKLAVVIGRSSIVGKPMSALLLQADATVVIAHSRTKDLREISKQADILVVAMGKRGFIDGSYVKPGAVVIDVGMHHGDDGKPVGDVIFDSAAKVASAITPVPGGVGPMTIALLLQNTVWAAERRESARH